MCGKKWPELPWDRVIDRVSPIVFRLVAGDLAGTAFVVSVGRSENQSESFALLATAWHVLERVPGSDVSVTLVSFDGKKHFDSEENAIGFYRLGPDIHDTAVLIIRSQTPIIDESDLCPMLPYESMMARGVDIGWLGYPGLVRSELCFFSKA